MEEGKHISWIKWKKNCLEKEKGGLGVKDVAMFMELLAK